MDTGLTLIPSDSHSKQACRQFWESFENFMDKGDPPTNEGNLGELGGTMTQRKISRRMMILPRPEHPISLEPFLSRKKPFTEMLMRLIAQASLDAERVQGRVSECVCVHLRWLSIHLAQD